MHLQHPSAVVCTSPRLFRRRNCGAMETSGIKGRTLARRIDRRAIFSESEVNDRVNRNLITETTEKRQCVSPPPVPALRIARLSKFALGERASQPPSSFSLSLSFFFLFSLLFPFFFLPSFRGIFETSTMPGIMGESYSRRMTRFTAPCRSQYAAIVCILYTRALLRR